VSWPMGGSPLARAGDGTVGRRDTRVPVAGSAGAGLLEVGFTPRNSGGIPRAGRAQDSSVVHASSPSREVEKGGPSVVPWRSVPPVSHDKTGRSSGFRFLGCQAGTGIPTGNRSSPVMRVLAAHAAIARERKKVQPRQAPGIPANSRGSPFACRPRPAVLQATRSRPSIGWLADHRKAGRRA